MELLPGTKIEFLKSFTDKITGYKVSKGSRATITKKDITHPLKGYYEAVTPTGKRIGQTAEQYFKVIE